MIPEGVCNQFIKEHIYSTMSVNFILYTRKNHKSCSSCCAILNSGTIGWIGTSEQGSEIHRGLLVSGFGISVETMTKKKSQKGETFGKVN